MSCELSSFHRHEDQARVCVLIVIGLTETYGFCLKTCVVQTTECKRRIQLGSGAENTVQVLIIPTRL
jgi:hypothetical protein